MAKLLTPPEWYDQNGKLVKTRSSEKDGSSANSPNIVITTSIATEEKTNIALGTGCVYIGDGKSSEAITSSKDTVVGCGSRSYCKGGNAIFGYNNSVGGEESEGGQNAQNNIVVGSNNADISGVEDVIIANNYQKGVGDVNPTIQIGSSAVNYSVIGFGPYKPYLLQYLGGFSKENVGVIGAPTTIDNNTLNNADIVECDIEYNNMRKVITAYKAQDAFTNIKVSTGMYLATPSGSSGSDSLVSFWFGWSSGSGWQLGSQKLTFSTSSTSFVKIEKQDNATIQGITLRCKCYKIIQNTVG